MELDLIDIFSLLYGFGALILIIFLRLPGHGHKSDGQVPSFFDFAVYFAQRWIARRGGKGRPSRTHDVPPRMMVCAFIAAPQAGRTNRSRWPLLGGSLLNTRSGRPLLLRNTFVADAILKYLHFFECDESARHHLVKNRQEGVNLFLAVDDLDDDRKILR